MKNTYVKPEMQVEEFLVNQYCSNCGKKDGKYIFTCDAPAGTLYYYNSSGKAKSMGTYHPCGSTHETNGPDGYYDGFIDRNKNGKEDEGESVLVWREYKGYGYSGHASASLSREQIEVERS